uniref:MABP domain-containing protein n=1 Tax=Astyanax mexicanus TaxID=7994 RepID=A0A8B9JDT6_ASTMX
MSMSSAPIRPITAVAWASSTTTCPGQFTLVSVAQSLTAVHHNIIRGSEILQFFKCYSGFFFMDLLDEFFMPFWNHTCNDLYIYVCVCVLEASVWKKKRVCVRMVPVDSVSTAVLDIRLTTKSKMMLQQYTCLGDMLGYVLWCGTFSTPPQAKPRSISLDMRKLSFDAAGPPLPLRPSNPPPAPPKISHRRSTLKEKESKDDSGHDSLNVYGITGK